MPTTIINSNTVQLVDDYIVQELAAAPDDEVLDLFNETKETSITKALEAVLRSLPKDHRISLKRLRFIVHPDTRQDYVQSIAVRQGNMADQYLAGLVGDPLYVGIPVVPNRTVPKHLILLVNPDDLELDVGKSTITWTDGVVVCKWNA